MKQLHQIGKMQPDKLLHDFHFANLKAKAENIRFIERLLQVIKGNNK